MDKIELIHTIMLLGADTYNKTHTDRYEAQLKAEKLLDKYIQQVKNLNIPAVIKSVCDRCEGKPENECKTLCDDCYQDLHGM
jgi:hypothetical protein